MFFNCFLSGQHNLMSTPQTAYTEFHAKPLSIQYEVHSSYYRKFEVVCHKAEGTHQQCMGTNCRFISAFRVGEVDIQWALFYLYTKATGEVDKFSKPDKIQRDMFRLGGILFHKSRIADGRRYIMSGNMKNIESVAAQNINLFTPVVDRWSPLAYSLADLIHTDVSSHSGHESTFRKSFNFCFILQGLSLFKEIGSSCVFCTKLRAKFIQATMGPKDPSAYALAQTDLYGPIEGHDAHHLADGLTRLCCEVGAPARLLIDRDSAFMKVLEEGHIDILDVESHMRKKTTMSFQLCPVDGHNFHGLVESTINSIQSAFKGCSYLTTGCTPLDSKRS